MLLRTQGPSAIFAEYRVVLHVPESDADKVRVFHAVREYLCLPCPPHPCVTPGPASSTGFVHWGAPICCNPPFTPKALLLLHKVGLCGKIQGAEGSREAFPNEAAGILPFLWRGNPHVAPGTV